MTSDRIKEIQDTTAYPDSVSVKCALLQVWNECEQKKWISVNERLPEFNDWYLVCKYDKRLKLMLTVEVKPFNNGKFLESGFTHWMLLPSPPKT